MHDKGVPGVLRMRSFGLPGFEWNTSRCSSRCSQGVLNPMDPGFRERLEHQVHRDARLVFQLGVPSQARVHAHSFWVVNTWHTRNTLREGRGRK